MKSKRFIASAGLLLLILALWHFGQPKPPDHSTSPRGTEPPARETGSVPEAPDSSPTGKSATNAPPQARSHPLAVSFGSDPASGSSEPATLLEIFEAYRRLFGSFPTGEDNPHIMKILMGANSQKLAIFPPKHPRLTEDGALLDAWKSPFFFHIISHDHIEIRSPGPDREIYSEDDIVVSNRPPAAD